MISIQRRSLYTYSLTMLGYYQFFQKKAHSYQFYSIYYLFYSMQASPLCVNYLNYTMTHASYIANNADVRVTSKRNIERNFGPYYRLHHPDDPLENLEFYLKYDDFSLDFLRAVFNHIPETKIAGFIDAAPASKQPRKIGYLYEWLTGKQLVLSRPVGGNYTDLLNPEKYLTGEIRENARWRINDNLLGTPAYCPVVRRTQELKELLNQDLSQKLKI